MQVNSLNNSYISYDVSSQKKTESTSFASEMDEVNKHKVVEEKGKMLTFLESDNAFEGFSKEEEIKFKSILKDDKVTQEEFESISYEMLEKFKTLVLPSKKEHFETMPYIEMTNKSKLMLSTIDLSSDRYFNESVYKTYGDMSENDIVNTSFELHINLNQAYNKEDLEIFYIGMVGKINNISPDVMKEMTMDVQKVLLDMISMSSDYIEKVKDPQVLKQLNNTKNFYSSILTNYNELKKETFIS